MQQASISLAPFPALHLRFPSLSPCPPPTLSPALPNPPPSRQQNTNKASQSQARTWVSARIHIRTQRPTVQYNTRRIRYSPSLPSISTLLLLGHEYGGLLHLIWAHASESLMSLAAGGRRSLSVRSSLSHGLGAAGSPRSLITVIRGDPGPRRL